MGSGRSAKKMSVGRGPRPRRGVRIRLVAVLILAALAVNTGRSPAQGAGLEEIGPDDLRVSHMGPDGDTSYGAFLGWPVVAWAGKSSGSLVVWAGDDLNDETGNDEVEIFGRFFTRDLEPRTDMFRISFMGADGSSASMGLDPAAACGFVGCFVVWWGDTGELSLADDEFEIWGQRITGSGELVGDPIRISEMGPDGNTNYAAWDPAVAWGSSSGAFLVTWTGDDDTAPLVDDEVEIFARFVKEDGTMPHPQQRVSFTGPDGHPLPAAASSSVAYGHPIHDRFLVVWSGDHTRDDKHDIYGQRIWGDPDIGSYPNNFLIGRMGLEDDVDSDAFDPAVARDYASGDFFVVWTGDDAGLPLGDEDFEIYGQHITHDGFLIGPRLKLSEMGSSPATAHLRTARAPGVTWVGSEYHTPFQFVVTWWGDDDSGGLVDEEAEIWATKTPAEPPTLIVPTSSDSREIVAGVPPRARLSTMGPDGDVAFGGFDPAIVGIYGEALVVWWGDDDRSPLVDDEFEIFAQEIDAYFSLFEDGFESGDTSLWSATFP